MIKPEVRGAKNARKQIKIKAGILYSAFAIAMIICLALKQNLHLDETLTYTLSNNTVSTVLSPVDGHTYTPVKSAYLESMTVPQGGQFNYANVWQRQAEDVHPPFYYVLVHTVCSLFPGKFSVWFSGIVNIVFALLTLWVSRKIVRTLMADQTFVLIISVFLAASAAMLSIASFLRMYTMAMFFTTSLGYLFLKGIRAKKLDWKYYLLLSLTSIAGVLTHYFVIVYLVLNCCVFGVCLILTSRYKDALALIGTMLFSAVVSILIFPNMLRHIFSGYRGDEAFHNLGGDIADYWSRLKSFYGFVSGWAFGGCLTYLAIMALIIFAWERFGKRSISSLLCCGWEKLIGKGMAVSGDVALQTAPSDAHLEANGATVAKNSKAVPNITVLSYLILAVPSVAYFLLVSKIASYTDYRYISPIYAVVVIWVLCLVLPKLKALFFPKICVPAVYFLLCAMIVSSWVKSPWEYLYFNDKEQLEKAAAYNQVDCVCIYPPYQIYQVQPTFYEASNYKSVTFYEQEHIDMLMESDIRNALELMVLISNACDSEVVAEKISRALPNLNAHQLMWSVGGTNTYHFYHAIPMPETGFYLSNYEKTSYMGCDESGNVCLVDYAEEFWMKQWEDPALPQTIYLGDKALDIQSGIIEDGTNIQTFDSNDTDAQQWQTLRNSDGSVTFLSIDKDLALTYAADGNIYLKTYDENDSSMKWWVGGTNGKEGS